MRGLLLFFLLSLNGCAIWVITPNPRVESPELRGDRGLKIGGDVGGAHAYNAVPDGSTRPPTMNQPDMDRTVDTNASFLYSPTEPLEFGIEAHPFSAGLSAIVKWQPVGEGTRTAKEGNVPLGFYLRAGSVYSQASGDQKDLFGSGGYPWKGTINGNYVHAGFSVGYRPAEHALVYIGAAAGQYWNRIEVDQNAANGDTGGVYKASDTGFARTGGAGVVFNWHIVQFYVGGDYSYIRYTHAGAIDSLFFHGGFYFTPR